MDSQVEKGHRQPAACSSAVHVWLISNSLLPEGVGAFCLCYLSCMSDFRSIGDLSRMNCISYSVSVTRKMDD